VSEPTIEIANADECVYTTYGGGLPALWLFQVGACGPVYVAVWTRTTLEDALEELGGFLVDKGYDGLITPHGSEEAKAMYDEAREELGPDATDEEVMEHAEADMTYTESGWIRSWEWYVDEVDPRDEQYMKLLLTSLDDVYELGGSQAADLLRAVCAVCEVLQPKS
jgi:hypothetical protein